MRSHPKLFIIITAVAAVGVLQLLPAPASAASTYIEYAEDTTAEPGPTCQHKPMPFVNSDGKEIGWACFEAYGDVVWLADLYADGLRIDVRGQTTYPAFDGYGCFGVGGSAAGWQRCVFHDVMMDDIQFMWHLVSVDPHGVPGSKGEIIDVGMMQYSTT